MGRNGLCYEAGSHKLKDLQFLRKISSLCWTFQFWIFSPGLPGIKQKTGTWAASKFVRAFPFVEIRSPARERAPLRPLNQIRADA